jgi:protease-4
MDENFKNFAQQSVENIYTTFVSRVAVGRKMTTAQVDSIAQGRVWSGSEAKKIGLVDEIGGMDAALKYAALLAKVKEYRTINYPEYKKDPRDLLSGLGFPFAQTKEALIKEEIGAENYKVMQEIKRFSLRKGVQASMLYEIEIK